MPRVVVVGGGYAGTLVAKNLDRDADVVLIDPRDAFVNVAALLRALTQPDWAPNAFFPYANLLERGRVIRDRVTSVDVGGVVLASGDQVGADVIVLATGSSYPYPAHPHGVDRSSADALADLRSSQAQLEVANRVVILGAGPVGLELAGEIREAWPTKRVTVIARSDRLLPLYRPELHDDLVQQLAGLDIELRLGTRLVAPPATPPGVCRPFHLTTTEGEDIAGDLWFEAHGTRVASGYLDDGHLVTPTERGTVPVGPTLAVVGTTNVYAVGDVADLPDLKMATHAQTEATTVVENIRAQLAGQPSTAVYPPARTQRIFLPLGTRAGVGQVPGPEGLPLVAPLAVVQERKGKDLFTSQFRRRFDVAPR